MNLFSRDYKISKPLRLIELFAGYGSQAMALKRAGIPFEHHFVCEFDKYAVKSYNAVHGTAFAPSDIREIHAADLKIAERDKFEYMMTYSFPCVDLSNAGRMAGMAKGSGTRSGLLWEVERILKECGQNLPHILMMENVKQVIGEKNRADFDEWCEFLRSLGYSNHLQVLNAKDYGVPQSRERAFMLSFLGDWDYEFPAKIPLEKRMRDLLEDDVDEKYFVKNERAEQLLRSLKGEFEAGNTPILANYNEVDFREKECARTLEARDYKGFGTGFEKQNAVLNLPIKLCKTADGKFVKSDEMTAKANWDGVASAVLSTEYKGGDVNGANRVLQIGNISNHRRENSNCGRVYDDNYVSPTLNACGGGGLQPFIVSCAARGRGEGWKHKLEIRKDDLANAIDTVQKDSMVLDNARIRRLTPLEYYRLMGVTDEDAKKMLACNSNAQCYKQAGNSIVVDVMVAMFEKLK